MTKTAKRVFIATVGALFLLCTLLFAACSLSYTVTLAYDHTQGSVTLDPDQKFFYAGDEVTVTVAPNEGYDVDAFTVNGREQMLTDLAYTFTVKDDVLIEVTFKSTTPDVPPTPDVDYEAELADYLGTWHTQEGDKLGAVTVTFANDGTVAVSNDANAKLNRTVTPGETFMGETAPDTITYTLTWNGKDYELNGVSYGVLDLTDADYAHVYLFKDGEAAPVTTFEKFVGEYTSTDGAYTLVITENSFKLNDVDAYVYSDSYGYNFYWKGARYGLNTDFMGTKLELTSNYVTIAEFALTAPPADVTEFEGTWKPQINATITELVFSDNELFVNDFAVTVTGDYVYTFEYDDTTYYFVSEYDSVIKVYENLNNPDDGAVYYIKEGASSIAVDDAYKGKWEDKDNALVLEVDGTVTINGTAVFVYASDVSFIETLYKFLWNNESYDLSFSTFFGNTLNGNTLTPVEEAEDSNALPAYMRGQKYLRTSASEDYWIVVSEDGLTAVLWTKSFSTGEDQVSATYDVTKDDAGNYKFGSNAVTFFNENVFKAGSYYYALEGAEFTKAPFDLSETTWKSEDETISVEFNADGTFTYKKGTTTRTGKTYFADSETGTFLVLDTKSNSKNYQYEIVYKDGKMTFRLIEDTATTDLFKEGGEEPADFIGEALQGVWTGKFGEKDIKLNVTADTITVTIDNGAPLTATGLRQWNGNNEDIYFTLEGYVGEFNLYISNLDDGSTATVLSNYTLGAADVPGWTGSTHLTKDSGGTVEPDPEEPEDGPIAEVLWGNWEGVGPYDAKNYKFKVTAGKITITLEDGSVIVATNVRYFSADEPNPCDILFDVEGYASSWNLYTSDNGVTVTVYTYDPDIGNIYLKKVADPDHPAENTVPEDYRGTFVVWDINDNKKQLGTIEVGHNFVTLELTSGVFGTYYVTADDILSYGLLFTIGGTTYCYAVDRDFTGEGNITSRTLGVWDTDHRWAVPFAYISEGTYEPPVEEFDPIADIFKGVFEGTNDGVKYTVTVYKNDVVTVKINDGKEVVATLTYVSEDLIRFTVDGVECAFTYNKNRDEDDTKDIITYQFQYGEMRYFTVVRTGSADNYEESGDELDIPELWQGVYTSQDEANEYELTVEKDSVTLKIDGQLVELTVKSFDENDGLLVSFNGSDWLIVPAFDLDAYPGYKVLSMFKGTEAEGASIELYCGSLPAVIPDVFCDDWTVTINGQKWEIHVETDSITITINGAPAEVELYFAGDEETGVWFFVNEDDLYYIYLNSEDGKVYIADAYGEFDAELTKAEEKEEGIVAEQFVGTWTTQEGNTAFGVVSITIDAYGNISASNGATIAFAVEPTLTATELSITYNGVTYLFGFNVEDYGPYVLRARDTGWTYHYFFKDGCSLIPADLIGTWKNASHTLVVTKDGATLDGSPVFIYVAESQTKFFWKNDRYWFTSVTSESTSLTYNPYTGGAGVTLTKEVVEEPTVEIPEHYFGTWVGTDNDTTYKLVISETDGIKITVNSDTYTASDVKVENAGYVQITFYANSVKYVFMYAMAPTLQIGDGGIVILQASSGEEEPDLPPVQLPEELTGTFSGEYNNVKYTLTVLSGADITLEIGDNSYTATDIKFNASWEQLTFTANEVEWKFYPRDDGVYDVFRLSGGGVNLYLSKDAEGGDTEDGYTGTWTTDADEVPFTSITVAGNKVTVDGSEYDLTDNSGFSLSFFINDVEYRIFSDESGLYVRVINWTASGTYYFVKSGATSIAFDPFFNGIWKANDGRTLTISAEDGIKLDGVAMLAYSQYGEGNEAELSVIYKGQPYTLKKHFSVANALNFNFTAFVKQADEGNEGGEGETGLYDAFVGTWSGNTTGGRTSFAIKIEIDANGFVSFSYGNASLTVTKVNVSGTTIKFSDEDYEYAFTLTVTDSGLHLSIWDTSEECDLTKE